MALLTLNSYPVLRGRIAAPRVGVWHADLDVSTEEPLAGAAVISSGGTELYRGTLTRSISYLGITQVRVVGGGAGLGKPATPRFYAEASLNEILGHLTRDAGETVVGDADLLARRLANWTTIRTATGRIVAELIRPYDVAWRVLPDGRLWMGAETWPDYTGEWRELTYDHANGVLELGLDAPVLTPGVKLGGFQVERVEHRITSEAVRTLVWSFQGREGGGGIADDFAALARAGETPFDFLALYSATMTRQETGAQLFDIRPDDDRLPGMPKLTLRNGLPGLTVQVSPGAKMLVGWHNGDPRLPYCMTWGGGETVTQIIIEAASLELGGAAPDPLTQGVLVGACMDPFTGSAHSTFAPAGVGMSLRVKAKASLT